MLLCSLKLFNLLLFFTLRGRSVQKSHKCYFFNIGSKYCCISDLASVKIWRCQESVKLLDEVSKVWQRVECCSIYILHLLVWQRVECCSVCIRHLLVWQRVECCSVCIRHLLVWQRVECCNTCVKHLLFCTPVLPIPALILNRLGSITADKITKQLHCMYLQTRIQWAKLKP